MKEKRRILIVDDNQSIHDDFKKILIDSYKNDELDNIEEMLFDEPKPQASIGFQYIIDDAYQGEEAIKLVDIAEEEGFPYALIFMDVRMPPGIDGVQAIDRIWKVHPNIEMVICSAYSDYSWDEILDKFGSTDKLLFVKKPFNVIVIKQLALSLTTKWDISNKNRNHLIILEEEVKERTKELQKLLKAMEEMKIKAEESNRLKSAFLANMSHEIRSPMNSILGFSDLLMSTDLTEETRLSYLKLISNSGKSLLNLINDIIHVAKIEAGVVQVENIDFNLNKLLLEIKEVFENEMSLKNKTHILFDMIPDAQYNSLVINSDPERLKQIFINLITNAIKFTDEGSITFGYTVEKNNVLQFHVKDTGMGIPEDKLETIFERFGQVGDDRQKSVNGTGLGLTISKNLAEIMGGKLWIKSKPLEGSSFYFTIPLKSIENTNEYIDKKNDFFTKNDSERDVTILIAEDEKNNWILLEQLLKAPNRTLVWAQNGIEAIKQVESDPSINLVLMDIKMPLMNGTEATKQIKLLRPQLPIIAQTAFAMAEEEREFKNLAFDDYITKPINRSELQKKVDYWLIKEAKTYH